TMGLDSSFVEKKSITLRLSQLRHVLRGVALVALASAAVGGCAVSHSTDATDRVAEGIASNFVQTAWTTPQEPLATVSVELPQAQHGETLNAVAIGWNDTTRSITSVNDSNGNTYQLAAAIKRGPGLSQAIYYAPNIKPGNNTVTVTFDGPAAFVDLRVVEY